MKNKLNLIPLEVKQKRKKIAYTKTGLLLSLIPGIIVGQTYISMFTLENKISETQENIRIAGTLESQIQEQEDIIMKNKSIMQELTSGGLPLNQFLLFTGLAIPEDIRLYSITSANIIKDRKNDLDEGENIEEAVPVETENSKGTVENEESTNEKVKVEEPIKEVDINVDPLNTDIIIKGAALNVNSIGIFMGDLENRNDYIKNVDIVEVQNYRDDVFNYKMFELIVELQN